MSRLAFSLADKDHRTDLQLLGVALLSAHIVQVEQSLDFVHGVLNNRARVQGGVWIVEGEEDVKDGTQVGCERTRVRFEGGQVVGDLARVLPPLFVHAARGVGVGE